MSRSDKIALFLSLVAVIVSYWVANRYYENMAHLEDEQAYVWQAQVLARGKLTLPSPTSPKSFLWPFVVDYEGQRFGKYPLGWPLVLTIGEILDQRSLVNPLLAGLGIWLIYLLCKRMMGETVGLLAAGLTVTSPFFLVNSASLLSHPLGLVLSAGFALAWLRAFGVQDSDSPPARRLWGSTILAALLFGALILTRPLTAVAIAVPFFFHALVLLLRGGWELRRRLLVFAALALLLASLHFAWQYAVTGDPFLNPYTLWWDYDRVGFGPGHGHRQQGHTLQQAWINTRFSLKVAAWDIFGWPRISWLFLPFGLLAILFNRRYRWEGLLVASVFPVLVLAYMAYWVGASLYGPRYFFEGLYSLALLSAAGIALLAGWPVRPGQVWQLQHGWKRLRPLLVSALVGLLVAFNLFFYTPPRLAMMYGLYGVSRSHLQPFLSASAQELTPALIIVHPHKAWIEYGTLLELQNPFMDSPFVFIHSRGPTIDTAVANQFPGRAVFHYYPDEPYRFYTYPR